MTAKHLPGVIPLALARSDAATVPLGCGDGLGHRVADRQRARDALGGAILQHVESRRRRRQLDRDVRGPPTEPSGHRQHGLAIPGLHRIHLGTDIPGPAAALFVLGQQLLGHVADRDVHQFLGLLLGLGVLSEHLLDLARPRGLISLRAHTREKGICGRADGPALDPAFEFRRVRRVVPPGGPGFADCPTQIILFHPRLLTNRHRIRPLPAQDKHLGDSFPYTYHVIVLELTGCP